MSAHPPQPRKPSGVPQSPGAGGQLSEERLAHAVAARMLELLRSVLENLAAGRPSDALVDAATLGRQLGVSHQFVYEHAEELGVLRLGLGDRPTLRFDLETPKRACRRIAEDPSKTRVRTTPPVRRRRQVSAPELLPLRDRPVR
jgi:hypothetical protein